MLARVKNNESYRKIARDYGVSRETIRRLVQALKDVGSSIAAAMALE